MNIFSNSLFITIVCYVGFILSSLLTWYGVNHKRQISGAYTRVLSTLMLLMFVFLFTSISKDSVVFLIAYLCLFFRDVVLIFQISKKFIQVAFSFSAVAYACITLGLLPYANFNNFIWPIPFLLLLGFFAFLFVAKNIGKKFIFVALYLVVSFIMVELGCISSYLSIFGLATILMALADFNIICYNYSDDYGRLLNSETYDFAVFVPWNIGLVLLTKGILGV